MLILSLLWGASFLFVKIALRELPPLSIVFLRVTLGGAVLWCVVAYSKCSFPGGSRLWISFLVMGVLNNAVPFTLLVWGQTRIASGLAAILNATTPLFTVIVAGAVLADERITFNKIFGLVLGLGGTIVMIGPSVLSDLGSEVWAQVACLGAALSYALAGVYGRRFAGMGITPSSAAAGQASTCALVLLPFVLWIDQPWQLGVPSATTWAVVVALAVLSTGLAHILYFRVLSTSGATNVMLVTFLVPISAIVLGMMFLDEQLQAEHITGMALIGLGLVAIDGRWRLLLR